MINISLLTTRRHGSIWKDNIKMHLREIGPVNMDWVHLPWNKSQQWAPVNTVMNMEFHEGEEFHDKLTAY